MALPDVQAAHPQAPALVRQQQRDDHDRHQYRDRPQRELTDGSRHMSTELDSYEPTSGDESAMERPW